MEAVIESRLYMFGAQAMARQAAYKDDSAAGT